MGELKFRLPAEWSLERRQASMVHTVGLDGVPWPCKISFENQILTVSRNRQESGKTFVPWIFEDYGELLISTGTLAENETPYPMLTELTRGTLCRLRNQISIWEEGGLKIPTVVFADCAAATTHLGNAIMHVDPAQQDALATLAIESTLKACFALSDAFGQQVSQFRKNTDQMHPFWIANTVSPSRPAKEGVAVEGFELARMNFSQLRDLENQTIPKRVIAGPLLDASVNGIPDELLEAGDYAERRKLILKSCKKEMSALSPSVSLLHVVGGLNGMGHRHLSYPQQLELTTQLLDEVSNANVEVPTMISFDFPWAERLASAVGGTHPLQIADSLLRQGAQVSFLGIEVNLGYFPNGSAMRDPLQWIDMLDVWTQLGLPLIILLRAPTWSKNGKWTVNSATKSGSASKGDGKDDGEDENGQNHIAENESVELDPARARHVNAFDNSTDRFRLNSLQTVLQMLVARPAVHGVIWSQWLDGDDDRYPYGGLSDDSDQLKAVCKMMTNIDR